MAGAREGPRELAGLQLLPPARGLRCPGVIPSQEIAKGSRARVTCAACDDLLLVTSEDAWVIRLIPRTRKKGRICELQTRLSALVGEHLREEAVSNSDRKSYTKESWFLSPGMRSQMSKCGKHGKHSVSGPQEGT